MLSSGAPSTTRFTSAKAGGERAGSHVMGIDNGGKVLDFKILLIRRDAQYSCVYFLSSLLPKLYTL